MPPRQLRARKDLTSPSNVPAASSRPRRAAATNHPGTTIERSSPDEGRHSSIRLTVKSDPKKLRDATNGSSAKDSIAVNSRNTFVGGEIVVGPRQTRKKPIVESDSDSDEEDEIEEDEAEEEEEDEDGEGEDEDGEGEEEDEEEEDEEEEDEEDLDAEGEEDTEMIDVPLPTLPPPRANVPTISVDQKEMALDDDDDDELSSLDEDAEGEMDLGEEDAEGEDDDELDSDGEIVVNSRAGTPDLNKLTRRQRAAFEEFEGGLMALSNGIGPRCLMYVKSNHYNRGAKEEAPDCRRTRHA
jgi:Ino eighty subunit 2